MAVKVKKLVPEVNPATLAQKLDKPGTRVVLGYILNFFLGLATSCVSILGEASPFGLAMVGASGTGTPGLCCLLGSCLGYMLTGTFDRAVRYIATILLIFTVCYVFQRAKIFSRAWFVPLAVAAMTAVTAFLGSFQYMTGYPGAVGIFTEAVFAGGAVFFFTNALFPLKGGSEEQERIQCVSLLVLCACLLMALAGVKVANVISIGRLLAVLVILTAAFKGGMLPGCAAGTALGIAMDMSGGAGVFFSMAFAFAGLVSGAFSKHGRLVFLISYILANAAAVLWTWTDSFRVELMFEVFAATVVFAILPDRFLEYVGSFAQLPVPATGESGLRRYAAARARRVGEAFRGLYGTVFRSLEVHANDNDAAAVFDRAAENVCANCKKKEDCWQKNFMDTLSVMNDATAPMLKRGKLVREDMAERFLEKCPQNYAFISAVNSELRSMTYRRQFKSRLNENRTAAYGQYKELADIIDGVADELKSAGGADPLAERRLKRFLRTLDISAEVSVFRDCRGRLRTVIESGSLRPLLKNEDYMEQVSKVLGVRLCQPPCDNSVTDRRLELAQAEPLTASVGIAGMKKRGESVSGDRGTYFKTDTGILCVILADGMGSGADAASESINAAGTLEEFLRAGVDPAVAMKLLNSVLLLKNGEQWGYSTIDLMCIDLFTGETCFYKYGAAPSFVKNGKIIRRVRGESLAAGICAGEGSTPDIVRMRLKPGNVAIIASDGVVAESRDNWLREILVHDDGMDTKTLAADTLKAAVRQYGCDDDMTVLAVRVDERV